MTTDVRRLFTTLVLEGALLTGGLAGCDKPAAQQPGGNDEAAANDPNAPAEKKQDTDIQPATDTDTDVGAACPSTCVAADYSLSGSGDWATCFPDSDVCCWVSGECCDLCCD